MGPGRRPCPQRTLCYIISYPYPKFQSPIYPSPGKNKNPPEIGGVISSTGLRSHLLHASRPAGSVGSIGMSWMSRPIRWTFLPTLSLDFDSTVRFIRNPRRVGRGVGLRQFIASSALRKTGRLFSTSEKCVVRPKSVFEKW